MLKRRQFLALGGVSAGVIAMPKLLAPPSGEFEAHAATAEPPPYVPFSTAMPMPPVLRPTSTRRGVDRYRLDITPSTAELLPGCPSAIYSYGGTFTGPVIRARRNRPAALTFRNTLPAPANVHLHGGHVAAEDDGHPMDLIQPGESRTYHYPNSQQATSLWLHDHSHHTEAAHVYQGLHAFYLIRDRHERRLRLPRGRYDVPIMLREGRFDEQGTLVQAFGPTLRTFILVNGRAQPFYQVQARRYRLRLLNSSSNGRLLRLSLAGATMNQIGTDGGLLPAPLPRTELLVSPGERADVVVDFGQVPAGTPLMLTDSVKGDLLRFDVVPRRTPDTSRLPDELAPAPALPPATNERDVVFRMEFTPGSQPRAFINDKPFDPDRVDFTIRRGTTEIWNIVNADGPIRMNHNFHMHLAQFLVLERDGAPAGPDESGWRDTVFIPPGGRVKVKATFTEYLGRYMYHCHFLEHSRVGMMAQMEIVR
ncbi:MAG: multicopper oxidase family protein [Thermocrispum sp.]